MGRDLAGTIEAVETRAAYMLRFDDSVFASLNFVQAVAVSFAALTARQGMADPDAAWLGEIAGPIAAGKVFVTVNATYPLTRVAAAQHQ